MKIKFYLLILGLITSFTAFTNVAWGLPTEIYGAAYSKNIGVIHFDSKTTSRILNYTPSYTPQIAKGDFIGPRQQIYISPAHPHIREHATNMAYRSYIYNFSDKKVASCKGGALCTVHTDETSCNADTINSCSWQTLDLCHVYYITENVVDKEKSYCLLGGFMWSDAIGFTMLTGHLIQDAIGTPSEFPLEKMARIHFNGSISGYIWNGETGWIRLAHNAADSCSGLLQTGPGDADSCDDYSVCTWHGGSCKNTCDAPPQNSSKSNCEDYSNICHWTGAICENNDGVTTLPEDQGRGNWGVYVENINNPSADLTKITSSSGICESYTQESDCRYHSSSCTWDTTCKEKPLTVGRALKGYAWSEKLGWIEFSKQEFDGATFTHAGYTNWIPDLTPPEFYLEDNTWFVVGENTGYSAGGSYDPTALILEKLAFDGESEINWRNSIFKISRGSEVCKEISDGNQCNNNTDNLCQWNIGRCEGHGSCFEVTTKTACTNDPYKDICTWREDFCGGKKGDKFCKDLTNTQCQNSNFSSAGAGTCTLSATCEDSDFLNCSEPALNISRKAGGIDTCSGLSASDCTSNANCSYEDSTCVENESYLTAIIPSVGFIKNTAKGYCKYTLTGTVTNHAGFIYQFGGEDPQVPMKIYSSPITFYVRAGNIDFDKTKIELPATPGTVADGTESLKYTLKLKDLANNPTVKVDCSSETVCSARDPFTVKAVVDNQMSFDAIYHNNSDPLSIDYGSGSTPHDPDTDGDEITIKEVGEEYAMELTSYAPTVGLNSFNLQKYTLEINDGKYYRKPLSPIGCTGGGSCNTHSDESACTTAGGCTWLDKDEFDPPLTNPPQDIDSDDISSLPINVNFVPGVETENGNVTSGGLPGQIMIGSQATLSYDLRNRSNQAIDNIDIDNIFEYFSKKANEFGAALLDTQNIHDPTATEDAIYGWSDPIAMMTRYEIFDEQAAKYDGTNLANGPTQSSNSNFARAYPLNWDIGDSSDFNAGNKGDYNISGIYGIPKEYSPIDPEKDIADPHNYLDGTIDRSDEVDLSLNSNSVSASHQINFTPEKIVPPEDAAGIVNVNLRLKHQIAYRYSGFCTEGASCAAHTDKTLCNADTGNSCSWQEGQDIFTIYEPEKELIPEVEITETRVGAHGIVESKNVYQGITEREFTTIRKSGSRNTLTKSIHANVSSLTTGRTACAISGTTTLTSFSTSGCGIIHNPGNKTVIAYYEGDENKKLVLGDDNGTGTIIVPEGYRYTIILKGGANLFIKNNIAYIDPDASFGMILLSKINDKGSNVYIHPYPTNIVGILYAEGSLMSMDDSEKLYYSGSGGGDALELKNQLYWQGNIASRNTIGGTVTRTVPDGISCAAGTKINCAQRYDLDYIRRFTASEVLIANGGKFSGGGCCNGNKCGYATDAPCTNPQLLPLPLPTTITLVDDKIDTSNSKSTDAFFIEPVTRILPSGFVITEGLESFETIR